MRRECSLLFLSKKILKSKGQYLLKAVLLLYRNDSDQSGLFGFLMKCQGFPLCVSLIFVFCFNLASRLRSEFEFLIIPSTLIAAKSKCHDISLLVFHFAFLLSLHHH